MADSNTTGSQQGKDDNSARVSSPGASPLHPDSEVTPTAAQVDRERLEAGWKADLSRLEYEIDTLRTVLIAKNGQAAELKRKLGITPMVEMKQDLQQGLQTIRESDAVQKTGTALRTFGSFASRKLTDIRNSNAFKSMEEKVGGAYQSVTKSQSVENFKSRLTRSASTKADGFEDTVSGNAVVNNKTTSVTGVTPDDDMTPVTASATIVKTSSDTDAKPANEKVPL